MLTRSGRMTVAALVAVAASIVAGGVEAQSPTPLPDGAQELMMEMTRIQNQLMPMQQEAMADPEIRAAGEELGATIIDAMEEMDPETPALIARLNELAPQVQAAQEAQDQARLAELASEAGEIDQHLQITRDAVIQQPEIDRLVVAFEERVQNKMKEDNAEAAELLSRLETLSAELSALLRSAR